MALLSGSTVSGAIQDPKNALAKLVASEKDDTRLTNELFQRVLSREASPREIEATAKIMSTIDSDNAHVLAEWQAKEKEQAPIIVQKEKDRVTAIAAADKALKAYEATTKFYRDEREAVRKERAARGGGRRRFSSSRLRSPRKVSGP